jgi:hypothetical protein
MAILFPHSDLTKPSDRSEIINRIAFDSASFPQRQLLERKCMSLLAQNGFWDAFACAELLNDLGLAIEVFSKAAQVEPKVNDAL